jgi:hypothetical protein
MPTIWPWGGFGWLKRSRFRVQGSGFKVRCSMFFRYRLSIPLPRAEPLPTRERLRGGAKSCGVALSRGSENRHVLARGTCLRCHHHPPVCTNSKGQHLLATPFRRAFQLSGTDPFTHEPRLMPPAGCGQENITISLTDPFKKERRLLDAGSWFGVVLAVIWLQWFALFEAHDSQSRGYPPDAGPQP